MSIIQVSAKMKVPSGMLEEYKQQIAEYIRQIKEKDTGTLQFDWFISSDKTECEMRETYLSSEPLFTPGSPSRVTGNNF